MSQKKPLILAIETSCDETAAALTWGLKTLSNVIASQIEIHRPWGGVVPHLARRAHQENIDPVIQKALKESQKKQTLKPLDFHHLDAIAVTVGPGLAIALEVGIKKAKEISQNYHLPLIAVNHMEGHLLSFLAEEKIKPKDLKFPALALLVSGGHTQLVLVKAIGQYQILGETLDDAAGEAFDKVAKMLGLPYPGGPEIARLAKEGQPKIPLPVPMAHHPSLNFSFSGLKTACLYQLKETPLEKQTPEFKKNLAASFQTVLVQSIILKLKKALEKYSPSQIFLGGGVINNRPLREAIINLAKEKKAKAFFPQSSNLLSDNAAMIGIAAYFKFLKKDFVKNINRLDRRPNLSLIEKI